MGLKALGSQQTCRSGRELHLPIALQRPPQYSVSSPGSLSGLGLWRAEACHFGRLHHEAAWLLSWAGGRPAPPRHVSPSCAVCAHARRAPRRRVFSLNPVEGYRPPTLAGHRDALVGVFFAHAAAAAAAAATGATPPALLTVSRDGALFCWAYARPPRSGASEPGGGAPGARAGLDEADGAVADGAPGGAAAAGGARDAAAAAADGAEGDAGGAGPAKRQRADGAAAAPSAFAGGPGPCMRTMRRAGGCPAWRPCMRGRAAPQTHPGHPRARACPSDASRSRLAARAAARGGAPGRRRPCDASAVGENALTTPCTRLQAAPGGWRRSTFSTSAARG